MKVLFWKSKLLLSFNIKNLKYLSYSSINLEIKKGELIAIVGTVGSGFTHKKY